MICGAPIWAAGSAITGSNLCFTCTTGEADDSDLFGTSYPWFCGGVKLADGSILAIMTEDRADESAQELVAFKLSGF